MLKLPRRIIRRLKWGVVGCGRFSEMTFIPTLQLLPKSKLISLYSHNIQRAQSLAEKFAAQAAYDNYDEFLKSDIDCIFVGSANVNHYEQVIKAAQAGKHILCEKPMAMTSSEAEEMIRVCRENNVFLTINYVHRYHPLVTKAKEIIEKGMIGKIVSISVNFNIDFAPCDNFRFKKDLSGGGALRDLGTHMIDLLRFFGGEIKSVTGVMDNIIYKSEVDDFASAIVKFENSGYGSFNVSYNTKKGINRVEILGYEGNISIDNLIGRKSKPCRLVIDLNREAKKVFIKRANKSLYGLRAIQKAFLHEVSPQVVGEDGLVNLRIIEELEKQCSLERNLN